MVASGAFAAVVPAAVDGAGASAEAAAPETTAATTLAAHSATIPSAKKTSSGSTSGYFSPVSFPGTPSPAGPAAAGHAATTAKSASSFQFADVASLGKARQVASKIAQEHKQEAAKQAKRKAARASLDRQISAGGVDGWIAEALDHMGLPQAYAPGLKQIILKESGGNPDAINNWDSNAAAGNHSEGLMQVIPSTFRAYVHPDFADRDVTDPVANITAGVRYMIDRYGLSTLAAGGRSTAAGGYLGY
ncbi:transglycosylase SLT domain-containing protein [Pseudonocardia phyllosphaerae]|uniref:transglycosylase SLT domain-containing protein n=1 Tax=Pseudonocardia phyllosphaerae TaxID=3390502 RepID=UPI0039781A26